MRSKRSVLRLLGIGLLAMTYLATPVAATEDGPCQKCYKCDIYGYWWYACCGPSNGCGGTGPGYMTCTNHGDHCDVGAQCSCAE